MLELIDDTLEAFEERRIGRREAVARLAAVVAGLAGGTALAAEETQPESTFRALGLNHIALRVTDVARSRAFYQKHLGLGVMSEDAASGFLSCGDDHFVALFKGSQPGLDHYCYTIPDYDPARAVTMLERAGFAPRRQGNRVYFDDPDGIEVQVAAPVRSGPG